MLKSIYELFWQNKAVPVLTTEFEEKAIWICKEDLEHHTKFFGTGSFTDGRTTPTPIEAFELTEQFGVVPPDYLDRFTIASQWYEEIQVYKNLHNSI